ncbi:hypothetical protein [Pedobacter heparinus]|uniref:hypothetical protein n=1 Tax=Pedobacter heparinus TaxID=984 RepID=UPI00292D4B25|nr:hypothetical protein [Pedobacter heparinus]
MMVTKKIGEHADGELIKISLINSSGFKVDIINYGAIIQGIFMPDASGNIENLVLS